MSIIKHLPGHVLINQPSHFSSDMAVSYYFRYF